MAMIVGKKTKRGKLTPLFDLKCRLSSALVKGGIGFFIALTLYNVSMQIYPSILESDIEVFIARANQYSPLFLYIQIDIADGKLVDNNTVSIEEIAQNVSSFIIHDSGSTFEFHLMVDNWEAEIPSLLQLKSKLPINRIIIHAPVFHDKFSRLSPDFEWGLALSPDDAVVDFWEVVQSFPVVQIMTVDPGRQGNPFISSTLDKIGHLRGLGYKGKIILDGGINENSLPTILSQEFWPDAVCPGSYFREAPEEKLKKLHDIVQKYKK